MGLQDRLFNLSASVTRYVPLQYLLPAIPVVLVIAAAAIIYQKRK